MTTGDTATPPAIKSIAAPEFYGQILSLCRWIEQWRTRQKNVRDPADMMPPFDRRAGFQSLFFFVALWIATLLTPAVERSHSVTATIGFAIVVSVSAASCSVLLVFGAFGAAKAQFWRALFRMFRSPKNYPFAPLIMCVEYDASQHHALKTYTTEVIAATLERIQLEESELRERLTLAIGTPAITVILGLGAGLFSTWENYHDKPSTQNTAVFFLSVMILSIGLFAMKSRIALFELSRGRALLSLILAERKAAAKPQP